MTPNPNTTSCKSCPSGGPGYRTPLDAKIQGPREKILYVICVQPSGQTPDYLAVVDVDPKSETYQQVISRCYMTNIGDELHHFGWNSCSSCYGNASCSRNKLVLPSLGSDRIYILDVSSEKEPKIHKVIEPSEVHKYNITALHTSHCLATGDVMISGMGNNEGDGKCDFLLIDPEEGKVKGTWIKGEHQAKFGYDFWYQPYWDTLISSEWGAPKSWKSGCHDDDIINPELYGTSLNIFSYKDRTLKQVIDLGKEGIAPLEIRFLHDPKSQEGYVGCGVTGNLYRFYRQEDGTFKADKVVDIPALKVEGYPRGDEISAMVTDILISLDDRFLYLSNWMQGDVRQYDITDTAHPKLVGQIYLGGKLQNDSGVKVIHDPEGKKQPDPVFIKGKRFAGSSQMIQLSLDGSRLYVSSSLYSPWDKDIYPDLVKAGTILARLNVDTVKGGLTLDEDFLVDFGKEPNGPALAHEMRYPGGDCTSDIWLVPEGDQ